MGSPYGLAADSESEVVSPPSSPAAALDMQTLENRLRETRAIDPLSKLRLKGQIDDLVAQFRQVHESGMSDRVGVLRKPYEQMLARVQSMLSRDPALAGDLRASRETIWHVLADPSKFRKQVSMKQ